jgi:hypothetical protein|nr:MAG TPA: hypothetical protein [Caudoviricetes sp.]
MNDNLISLYNHILHKLHQEETQSIMCNELFKKIQNIF